MKTTNMISHIKQYRTLLRGITFTLSSILTFGIFTTPVFADGVEKMKERSAAYRALSGERISTNLGKAENILKNLQFLNKKWLLE